MLVGAGDIAGCKAIDGAKATAKLIEQIPEECLAVAESGLRSHDDLKQLRAAGFDAFLIGEHLMLSPDPGAALRALLVPPASGG